MRFSTRFIFALLAFASCGLIAAGLVLGELAGLHPCHLCNLQRLLYMVFGVFSLFGVLLPDWRKVWSVVLAIVAAGGVIAAVQQSWMQYAPQQAIECGFGDPTLAEQLINWLGTQWPAMFMVTGFCTNKEWIFLGLSLANWSALCFFGLLCLATWQFLRKEPARRGRRQ